MRYLVLLFCLSLAFAESPWSVSHELEPGGRVIAQSQDGRFVALDSVLAPLTVWNLEAARIVALFEGHELEPYEPRDYDFPWPIYAVDRGIFSGDWLVTILSSSGLEVKTGLLAHHLSTGERLELAGGSCDAIAVTPEGFVTSCNQGLSLWQASEDGFSEIRQRDVWLQELLFDPERNEILGLRLDPLAEPGLEVFSYPELEPLRFVAGNFVRLLGIHGGQLITVSWTDDGMFLQTWQGEELVSSLPLPETYLPSLMLSPDGVSLLLELDPIGGDHRILRLADGALLENPVDLRFTFNLEQVWHPRGILTWSQATTYYHDLLRLWQPEETLDIITNVSDYQFIYDYYDDWQVLRPHEFGSFTAPLFAADPGSLVARMVSSFQESDEAGQPEIFLETVAEGSILATATVPVLDDSVRAYRYQFGLRALEFAYGTSWALWEGRYQWQCARGELMGQ